MQPGDAHIAPVQPDVHFSRADVGIGPYSPVLHSQKAERRLRFFFFSQKPLEIFPNL